MKRQRFLEEKLIGILREQYVGGKVADLARIQDKSEAMLYNWKVKCGGMDFWDAKRLKPLDDENKKLNKTFADQILETAALREIISKNWWSSY